MKSRRRLNTTPPEPVFFVDRNLGADELPRVLREAGFVLVVHDDVSLDGMRRSIIPDHGWR